MREGECATSARARRVLAASVVTALHALKAGDAGRALRALEDCEPIAASIAMREPMSPGAVGSRGGAATLAKHGREHYQAAGRKGGRAIADQRGSDYMRMLSRRGRATQQRRGGEGAGAS
jgi:general stress protein YciG